MAQKTERNVITERYKYELQILFSNAINNFVVETDTDVIVPFCC